MISRRQYQNDFCRFSLAVYRQRGVAEECPRVSALRSQVQRVEIEAEQVEQAMLFAYAQSIAPRVEGDAVACNVSTDTS